MNHVGCSDCNADLFAYGDDQRIVHFHQISWALGLTTLNLRTRGSEVRENFHASGWAVDVLVAPFPLVAGHFDRKVCAAGIFHRNDCACCGQGHGNHDQEWHDRPSDFDTHVLVEGCRLIPFRLSVRPD